jgi:hypothetical protein
VYILEHCHSVSQAMSDPTPDISVEDYTNTVVVDPTATPPPLLEPSMAQTTDASVDEYVASTVDSSSPMLESMAQNPDTSVEDYSNTVDPSSLADTVKVADSLPTKTMPTKLEAVKPAVTMPDSPTSSAGVHEERREESTAARPARRGCSTAALISCVAVALILLGAGLGVGFGTDAFDSILSSSEARESESPPVQVTPTPAPSRVTDSPTIAASQQPSFIPSDGPSQLPSTGPSSTPTRMATLAPTPTPTQAYYPSNPEPSSPPGTYFNYNPDSDYGPKRWARVNTNDHWVRCVKWQGESFFPLRMTHDS